ncbi:MAG TPA: hypothetical protein VF112_03685 [Candidatus Dormibacteraeota bacterium]
MWDEPGDAAVAEPGARRRRPLGHGGVAGVLLVLPLAALSLAGLGRALGPHPPPRTAVVTATTVAQDTTDVCFQAPPAAAPRHLPSGYRFLWELSSPYGDHGRQDTWVYNRSCADPDAAYPVLVIRITNAGAPLSAGDRSRGRPVELGSPQATAVYYRKGLPHDLHQVLCRGSYWFPDATVSCRWESAAINLLLVEARHGTYAILGGRTNGIGENELVAIAHRLPVVG